MTSTNITLPISQWTPFANTQFDPSGTLRYTHAIDPATIDHCIAGHLSAEGAHADVLARLGKVPLLALDMRLGEGSGAALAVSLLRSALACHDGMATFEEAGVANKPH